MRHFCSVLAGAVVFSLIALAPIQAQGVKLDSIVSSRTLENGLQVVVVRIPTIPFATVQMTFRAGAFVQRASNEAGLAHLIEHMLFRSGDGSGIADEASDIDAVYNGTTDAEAVRYFFMLPSKRLADGIGLMAKTVRKPSFSGTALETERKIVQGELERRASDPEFLMFAESDQMLWGDRAWDYKSAGGTVIALRAATPKLLADIYKRFYVPNNAALIVAGDVTDSVVFAIAQKQFGDWKRGPDPLAGMQAIAIEPLTAIKRKVQTSEVKDVSFFVRWQGPSVTADPAGTLAAGAFAGLVNQSVSRTQRRLVDGGLVDDLDVSYDIHRDVGPITLTARTSPDRAVAATRALSEELTRIVAPDYFDADDLVLAKKWQQVAAQFRLESSMRAATELANVWSAAGLEYYMDYGAKVDAQSPADVRKFVSTYIAGKPMAVVVLVPSSEWSRLGTELQRTLGAWKAP